MTGRKHHGKAAWIRCTQDISHDGGGGKLQESYRKKTFRKNNAYLVLVSEKPESQRLPTSIDPTQNQAWWSDMMASWSIYSNIFSTDFISMYVENINLKPLKSLKSKSSCLNLNGIRLKPQKKIHVTFVRVTGSSFVPTWIICIWGNVSHGFPPKMSWKEVRSVFFVSVLLLPRFFCWKLCWLMAVSKGPHKIQLKSIEVGSYDEEKNAYMLVWSLPIPSWEW